MVQGEGVSGNSSMEAEVLTLYSNGLDTNLWESGEYFISTIPSYRIYITLNPPQRPHHQFIHNLAREKPLCLGKGGLILEEMGRGEVGKWGDGHRPFPLPMLSYPVFPLFPIRESGARLDITQPD